MRVLQLYSLQGSGHHHASQAIAHALHRLNPAIETKQIDAFQYINPILARIIKQTYLGVLKTRPEVWEYLYDNPQVLRRVQRLRELIHRYNSGKLKHLLDAFAPDVVICTQAFPCGMVADYKATYAQQLRLVGTLTDYSPHSYWLFDEVDYYVVSSEEAHARMCALGISPDRLRLFGVAIDPSFARNTTHGATRPNTEDPVVLVMGGSTGFGPLQEILQEVDRLDCPFRFHLVTGHNQQLYARCMRRQARFRHPLTIESYVEEMATVMRQATLLITKPGGLTTAEALAVGLPMIIVNPIPGQETKNAEFLLKRRAAVRARNATEVAILTSELLQQPSMRSHMRRQALSASRPQAAFDTARLLCAITNTTWHPISITASDSISP